MTFQIDTAQVAACGNTFRRLEQYAADIAKLAEDANPEFHIWGLLGLKLFAPQYWLLAGGVHRHLEMVRKGLEHHAAALDTCVANYTEQDRALAASLKSIESALGGGH